MAFPANIFTSVKRFRFTILLFVLCALGAGYIISLQMRGYFFDFLFGISNALIVIILLVYTSRTRRFSYILIPLIALLIVVPIVYSILYSSPLNIGIVASFFETNREEVQGVGLPLLWTGIPIFAIICILSFLSVRELATWRIRLWKFTAFLLLAIILSFGVAFVSVGKHTKMHFSYNIKNNPLLYVQNVASVTCPLAISPVTMTISYFNEMVYFRKQQSKEKILPEGVALNPFAENVPKTIFLVIGESSVREHYSLYGYERETTPFLDFLYRDSLLYRYTAISPAPFTRDALRLSLSFATPIDIESFFDKPNNVQLANDAGYETYWLSNQDEVGINDSYVGLIASYAGTKTFNNLKKDDLYLLSLVREYYNPDKKQMFYIHLKGSHLPYDGYDSVDTEALGSVGEFSKYDKTIHHTDRVIHSLYNAVIENKDSDALILYYSDHGEIVNEGHGFYYGGAVQFHIPFVAIPVNGRLNIDEVIRKYFTGYFFNTVNLNYVLGESMGYSVSPELVTKAKQEGVAIYHVDNKPYRFIEDDE